MFIRALREIPVTGSTYCRMVIVVAKLACLFTFAIGSTFVNAATQEKHVLDACVRFATAIKVPFSKGNAKIEKLQLPRNRGVSWTVTDGERYYVVDDDGRYVKGFSDGSVERAARSIPAVQKPVIAESVLWKKSESILFSLDKGSKLSRWKYITGRSSRLGFPTLATCNFSQKAFGIDSAGVGNFLSISWDSRNGRIASLTSSTGWKYDKPRVAVDRDTASVLAGRIAQRQLGAKTQAKSIQYQFLMPIQNFGSMGNKFRREKRIRAGYVVKFSGFDVFLDAETGESLGGKFTRN